MMPSYHFADIDTQLVGLTICYGVAYMYLTEAFLQKSQNSGNIHKGKKKKSNQNGNKIKPEWKINSTKNRKLKLWDRMVLHLGNKPFSAAQYQQRSLKN